MPEHIHVQARFLLGPAGSGKTFRCLAELRHALREHPDGGPLIFLAPKQATFQLERQLLAADDLAGGVRLHILSFDRLAQFVLEKLRLTPPPLLSEEGRIMVLRALLRAHEAELTLFRRSAGRAGFAQELGKLLAELQQHGFSPVKLRALSANPQLPRELRQKLQDLAQLLEKYQAWLSDHALQDTNHLLDFATQSLRDVLPNPPPELTGPHPGTVTGSEAAESPENTRSQGLLPLRHSEWGRGPGRGGAPKSFNEENPPAVSGHTPLAIEGLWLDGFAEMTPQEQGLLAAVIPFCQRATLAFCLAAEPVAETTRLSIWSSISKTFQQCRTRLAALPGCQITVETLTNEPNHGRFAQNPILARLEHNWSRTPPFPPVAQQPTTALRLVGCQNPEAEAVFVAREILALVRAGNRYRDCAVLVRRLEGYHPILARVFRRYQIPFFLDRRAGVAHHPLAELTRNALRTIAFDWQNEDWFAALKAGFSGVPDDQIDALENAALESGWRGKKWREPLPDEAYEPLRQLIFPSFEHLAARLGTSGFKPDGRALAAALREFWEELNVRETLETWAQDEITGGESGSAAIHLTVWDQMQTWLDNVELAFPGEPMPLRDWLPVLEAGLANLTVGVIPPALDEVLIGAIDRARNPELKYALILGVNETIFPAPPVAPVILTGADRDELVKQNAILGPDIFDQICRERYLGYIACTRSGEKLALTFAHQSPDGQALNPSSFIAQIQAIFPNLPLEEFSLPAPDQCGSQIAHPSELVTPLVKLQQLGKPLETAAPDFQNWDQLLTLPALQPLAETLRQLPGPGTDEHLSPALADQIYGPVLRSSVSRLEEFAQCPFRFFVHSGLRAGERKLFELDARERGTFQHEVLKKFHDDLTAEGKPWRALTALDARERIGLIAAEIAAGYRQGLLRESARTRFAARLLTEPLQDFVATLVSWMHEQYTFDPARAEFPFGFKDSAAPAWEIELDLNVNDQTHPSGHHRKLALRGQIDRIDLHREGDQAFAVVMDYKSSQRRLDPTLMEHGIQLQLPAYLAAIRSWPPAILGAHRIIPAGIFYVNLRGQYENSDSRTEVLNDNETLKQAFRHSGRFDASRLKQFDRRPEVRKGDQFNFRLNKDGRLPSNSTEALPAPAFSQLLEDVEGRLRDLGRRIFSGEAAVDPYRKGAVTACDHCEYRAACRIDPWTHQWRVLRPPAKPETPE